MPLEEVSDLILDQISFSYAGSSAGDQGYSSQPHPLPVLSDVSASFKQGEISVILGPSGCGKSTLLHLIAGLMKPNSGIVSLANGGGLDGVGYVFQEPSLLPWSTVLTNALLGANIRGTLTNDTTLRAHILLKRYGLGGFEQAYPRDLSGGMRQRLAIIRAVLSGAPLLLLDEPFSDSDFLARRRLQEDLSEIVDQENLIALLVTHDLEEALRLGDKIYVLSVRPATVVGSLVIPRPRMERLRRYRELRTELRTYLERLWDLLGAGTIAEDLQSE